LNILEELLQIHKLKPVQLAKRMGISKGYCSMLLSGDRPISTPIAIKLKDVFEVPLEISLAHLVHNKETIEDQQAATLPKTG
jgi:plasmid maintenance system antidote protein VapI